MKTEAVKRTMAELEKMALAIIKAEVKRMGRGITCTELGSELFGNSYRNRQSYARPGGKIIASLHRKGLVCRMSDRHNIRFILSESGKKAAKK